MANDRPNIRSGTLCVLIGAWLAVSCRSAKALGEELGSEAAPVEIESEPMHHVRFKDAEFRVYEAIVPAGKATLFHTHRTSGVGVDLTATRLELRKAGGVPEQFETIVGDIWPANVPAAYTHQVSNLGAVPYRAIVAERSSTKPASARRSSLANVAKYELATEDELFWAYRLNLKPGESITGHALPARSLIVHVSGGQLLRFSGESSDLLVSVAPGEFAFNADEERIALSNVGATEYHAVVVEWK